MRKQIILITLFLFAFVAIASAVPTITTELVAPAASGRVVDIYILNASISGYGVLPSSWYCEFHASSPLTANSTYTVGTTTGLLANQTNMSAGGVVGIEYINVTVDTAANLGITIEDDSTYTFSAYCGMANGTATGDVKDEDTSTSVIVDNTEPQTPTTLAPAEDTILNYSAATFSATVVDANTSVCTLNFEGNNPGTTSYAGTHTSGTTTCTRAFSTTYLAEGVYMYYIQASDGTNTTDSVKTNITVDTPGGTSMSPAMIEQLREENLKRLGKVAINPIVIGLIIVAGYFVLFRKKR